MGGWAGMRRSEFHRSWEARTDPPSNHSGGWGGRSGDSGPRPPLVHIQPVSTSTELGAVGPPDDDGVSTSPPWGRGCSQTHVLPQRRVGNSRGALTPPLGTWMGLPRVLPHWETDGASLRLPWGRDGATQVLPQRETDGAPPRRPWGPGWDRPRCSPTGGNQQGTPVPPQVFSPGGRMGRPRAAPRGRDGVGQVLPQGDTGARAPQREQQCATVAVLRGCLEHVRALCDRPLRQVKESPLPLPFPLQKGLCAASPLVFFTSETSPRLPDSTAEGSLLLSFSTLCHLLPQNVWSASDCVPPPREASPHPTSFLKSLSGESLRCALSRESTTQPSPPAPRPRGSLPGPRGARSRAAHAWPRLPAPPAQSAGGADQAARAGPTAAPCEASPGPHGFSLLWGGTVSRAFLGVRRFPEDGRDRLGPGRAWRWPGTPPAPPATRSGLG